MSMQEQLKALLDKNMSRVVDLFRDMDADGSGSISAPEFREAMRSLGYEVPKKELDELFRFLDHDGSGTLEIKEVERALRKGARQMRRSPSRDARSDEEAAEEKPREHARRSQRHEP